MALIPCYNQIMGDLLLTQKGESYLITIYRANCTCAFIHTYTQEDGNKAHKLISFFQDKKHIQNMLDAGVDALYGSLEQINLNLYYKQSYYVLEYFVKRGYQVNCYYQEPVNN